MPRTLTPTQAKAILGDYDWKYLLIFFFDLKEKASDAEFWLKTWIEDRADTWCRDDDDEDGRRAPMPSYIVLETRENAIQGPVFYMLVAGTTGDVDGSVQSWNKVRGQTCASVHFQAFGEKAHLRRKALVTFLNGLFDLGCHVWHHIDKRHRISEEGKPCRRRQL